MVLHNIPMARSTLLGLTLASSFLMLAATCTTLGYELALTVGYNKPVPSLLTAAGLIVIFCIHALLPSPAPTSFRAKISGLGTELIFIAVLNLFVLAGTIRLHSSTPGLMSYCGGYFICSSLQVSLSLSWLTWFFLSLLFSSLLISAVYLYRRSRDRRIWIKPFGQTDWGIYNPTLGRGPAGNAGHRTRMSVQMESGKF